MRDAFGTTWDDLVKYYTTSKVQQYLENHRKHILRRQSPSSMTFDDLLEEVRVQQFHKVSQLDIVNMGDQLRALPYNQRHSSDLIGHWYHISTQSLPDEPRKSSIIISSRGAIASLFNATDPASPLLRKGSADAAWKPWSPAGITICIDGHFRSFRSGKICVLVLSIVRIGNQSAPCIRNAACPVLVGLSLSENKEAVAHLLTAFLNLGSTFHQSPNLPIRLISDSAPAIVNGTRSVIPHIIAQRCHFHAKQRVDKAPAPSEGNKKAYKLFCKERLDFMLKCAGINMFSLYISLVLFELRQNFGVDAMRHWELSWSTMLGDL
ncbi:hypothetical protein FOL47_003430, partial [Perkinsus chesapeaki]